MNFTQTAFDFDVEPVRPTPRRPSARTLAAEAAAKAEDEQARYNKAHRQRTEAEAREYWHVGMVTSLPCFATVQDSNQRYTQMLPGVIESIADDKAAVRIYAAPEYGYTIENYPLHGKLAIDVPLVELGKYGRDVELERIVADGLLVTGDVELAARMRARHHVHDWGRSAVSATEPELQGG